MTCGRLTDSDPDYCWPGMCVGCSNAGSDKDARIAELENECESLRLETRCHDRVSEAVLTRTAEGGLEKIKELETMLSSAREENERLLSGKTRYVAYKGNTIQHWYAKAYAYGGIVFSVCEAFRSLGYTGEFHDLDTLPQRLADFAASLRSSLAEKEAECERPRRCLCKAGLKAFMRDKSPDEVADHLQSVISSHVEAADKAESALAAAAKIMGCAPEKVVESVGSFCDDSINSAKEMYEMRDALAERERECEMQRDGWHECEERLQKRTFDMHEAGANLRDELRKCENNCERLNAVAEDNANDADQLRDAIDEFLPDYVLDDGTDEPANHVETIEFAGDDIRRLESERRLATQRAEYNHQEHLAANKVIVELQEQLAAAREENEALKDKVHDVTNRNLYRLRASQVGNLGDEFLSRCIGAEESAEKLTSGNAGHVRAKLLGELGWLREHVPMELLKKIDALENDLSSLHARAESAEAECKRLMSTICEKRSNEREWAEEVYK